METISEHSAIRITGGGKIKAWVTYALEYLENEENNAKPLVLHTLPAQSKSRSDVADAENPTSSDKPQVPNVAHTTSTIPRLISVVEIIKREYIKLLGQKQSSRLTGLHQYNEFGCLEELGILDNPGASANTEEQRAEQLKMALEGKNYPKQKQTPYMKVWLSHNEIPGLVEKGATYQSPLKRKLSKSAKARAKKRQKKDAAEKQASGSNTS